MFDFKYYESYEIIGMIIMIILLIFVLAIGGAVVYDKVNNSPEKIKRKYKITLHFDSSCKSIS